VIALVGYTNAGKSTLFNRLTGATVMAEDLLFATLDPTMRRIRLPGIDKAILSDTVGFISDLPTQLVAAFRATLEEVTAADVIVHVRDIANPDTQAQKRQVMQVLDELGLTENEGGAPSVPIVEAWNKWDLLTADQASELLERIAARGDEPIVPLSAVTGEGCEALLEVVGRLLTTGAKLHSFVLPMSDGQRLAWLHAHGEVIDEADAGEDQRGPLRRLEVRLAPRDLGRFSRL
jgi:GTP-binding protein HflX